MTMGFTCPDCHRVFKKKGNLNQHIKTHLNETSFFCQHCSRGFKSKRSCTIHENTQHLGLKYPCPKCGFLFTSPSAVTEHQKVRKYSCEHCCQHYDYWAWMQPHYKQLHSNQKEPPRMPHPNMTTRHRPAEPTDPEEASSQDIMCLTQGINPLDKTSKPKTFNFKAALLSKNQTGENKSDSPKRKKARIEMGIAPATSSTSTDAEVDGMKECNGIRESDIDDQDDESYSMDAENNTMIEGNGATMEEEESEETTSSDRAANDHSSQPPGTTDSDSSTKTPSQEQTGTVNVSSGNLCKPTHLFVFETWMMNTTDAVIVPLRQELAKKGLTPSMFASMLRGKWDHDTMDNIIKILSSTSVTISEFLKATIVIDFLRATDLNQLIGLFNCRQDFSPVICEAIELIVVLRLQKMIRLEFPSSTTLESLPHSISSILCLDFITILQDNETAGITEKSSVVTAKEQLCSVKMTVLLMEQTFDHFNKNDLNQNIRTLHRFVGSYMQKLINDHPSTAFDVLLEYNNNAVHARKVFEIPAEPAGHFSITLHEPILLDYKWKPLSFNRKVLANDDDCDNLKYLLYHKHIDQPTLCSKITPGVFELAERIGIKDIYMLMFRTHPFLSFVTKENFKTMLLYLFKLDRKDEITTVARNVGRIFTKDNIHNCVDEYPEEYVVEFLNNAHLDLTNLEKYGILISWAVSMTDRTCENPMKEKYDDEVQSFFDKVKDVLPLANMHEDIGKLIMQGYVKMADFLNARKMMNK